MGLDSKVLVWLQLKATGLDRKQGRQELRSQTNRGEAKKKKSNLKEMSATSNHCVLASPPHRTPLLLTYTDRRASAPTLCLQAANVSAGSLRAR